MKLHMDGGRAMIANTPPMGWNSWDCYGAAVTEDQVLQNAEYMAKHLKQYGWEYIVIDIQWSAPQEDSHEYHPFSELKMDECGRLAGWRCVHTAAQTIQDYAELSASRRTLEG